MVTIVRILSVEANALRALGVIEVGVTVVVVTWVLRAVTVGGTAAAQARGVAVGAGVAGVVVVAKVFGVGKDGADVAAVAGR